MTATLRTFCNRDAEEVGISDLFIAGITGEPRSWFVLDRLLARTKTNWCLIEPSEVHSAADISNQVNTRYPKAAIINAQQIAPLLHLFSETCERKPHIVIDVSCLSRTSMAEVFRHLFALASKRELTITVIYALASFTAPPVSLPANEDIRPVHEDFAGWPSGSAASTSLIVGLGYEREKAEGACEYFDPTETWVFVPRSPIAEYDQAVLSNNKELLARAERRHFKIDYRVNDPEHAFGELVSAVSSLLPRTTPLILPFGPKVFFALSLFVSFLYREVGVWFVTGDLAGIATDHDASGHLVAFEVQLAPCVESTGG